jgi:probable rRNA maturation factor
MAAINFFCEEIKFKVPNPRKTSNWLKSIARQENHSVEQLNYIFCSDSYLKSVNEKFLNHSYFTDIITFDNSEATGQIQADIYISIDRVRENAEAFQSTFATELRRVMAHGVLHLVGYQDKSASSKKVMRQKEEACLSLWR